MVQSQVMLGTFTGNVIIGNGAYIGSTSDTDAIQIEADGDVVLSQDLAVCCLAYCNRWQLY